MGNCTERSRRLLLSGGGYDQRNVYNQPLQKCSHSSMALTGFLRDGTCRTSKGDSGSHNICLDLTTAPKFCSHTNQSNWCNSSMPCHNNPKKNCSLKNWCVCEWAYKSYIDKMNNCAGRIDCNATNRVVLDHYKQRSKTDPSARKALKCLKSQCNI